MVKRKMAQPEQTSRPDPFSLPDGHHLGEYAGFEKKQESIYPAPMHADPMTELRLQRQELAEFVEVMNTHVHRHLKEIVRREQAWWDTVEKEYGIKRDDVEYHYIDRCFRKRSSAATPDGAMR